MFSYRELRFKPVNLPVVLIIKLWLVSFLSRLNVNECIHQAQTDCTDVNTQLFWNTIQFAYMFIEAI